MNWIGLFGTLRVVIGSVGQVQLEGVVAVPIFFGRQILGLRGPPEIDLAVLHWPVDGGSQKAGPNDDA